MTGLASGEPDTKIAAADTLVPAATGSRLDPAQSAPALTRGVLGPASNPNPVTNAINYATGNPLTVYRISQNRLRRSGPEKVVARGHHMAAGAVGEGARGGREGSGGSPPALRCVLAVSSRG